MNQQTADTFFLVREAWEGPTLHQRGININGRLTVHYPEILEGCEDAMDDTATQPSTQPLADPNGQHRSNVFDRELRDVICILHPTSEAAHKSVKKVAHASPQHILQNEHLEEGFTDAGRILQARNGVRSRPSYDIALRLSSKVLDIKMGFWFGRNPHRTDVFLSDPESKGARISNNHFRIYLTDEGIIMLEDNSTNGTCVDGYHLRNRPTLEQPVYSQSRALQHGSVITLVAGSHDEIKFIVQCPNRYEQRQNYEMEFARYCEVRQQEVQKAVAAQKLRDGLKGDDGTKTPGVEYTDISKARQGLLGSVHHPAPEYRVNSGFMVTSGSSRPTVMREWDGEPTYHAAHPLGKGAFASVYRAVRIEDGKLFAIKELERRVFKKANVLDSRVEDEVTIMKQLSHPHIIQYMEAAYKPNFVYIVMEYARDGSMADCLKMGFASRSAPEDLVKSMASQSLMALEYLHSKRITHRDIKPDNILVVSRKPFVVKLADFGLSKISEQDKTMLQTFCGTIYYCAPEVYADYNSYTNADAIERDLRKGGHGGRYYNSFCDIWSMGTVIFHLLAGKEPYKHHDRIGMLKLIMTTELNLTPLHQANVSPEGIDFTQRLIQRTPSQRPTATMCFDHPWLAGQDEAKMENLELEARPAPTFVDTNRNAGLGRRIKRKHGDYTGDSDEGSDHEQLSQSASRLRLDEGRVIRRGSARQGGEIVGDSIESVDDFVGARTRQDQQAHVAAVNAVRHPEALSNHAVGQDEDSGYGFYDQESDHGFWVSPPNPIGTQVPGNRLFGEISQSEAVKSSTISAEHGGVRPNLNQTHQTVPTASNLQPAASLLGAETLIGRMNMASPQSHTSPVATPHSPSTPVTPSTRSLTPSSARPTHQYDPTNSSTPVHQTPSRPFSRRVSFFPPDEAYWIPSKPHTYDPAYCDAQRAQNRQYQRWLEVQGEDYDDLVAIEGPQSESRDEYIARRITETKKSLAESSAAVPFPLSISSSTSTSTPTASIQVARSAVGGQRSTFTSPPPVLARLTSLPNSFAPIALTLINETTTWGREQSCTFVHPDPTDVRVPKRGLCIRFISLSDPSRTLNSSDLSVPQAPAPAPAHAQPQVQAGPQKIAAMLSTEATLGIRVNGVMLKKEDIHGNKLWGRLSTGDRLSLGKDLELVVELMIGEGRDEGAKFEVERAAPSRVSGNSFSPSTSTS